MTNAKVANLATQSETLDQTSLTLMGLFGPAQDLSALMRLPSGRVRRVKRGTRLSSGRVVGIDTHGVLLEKNGTTRRLAMPGS
ncbi:hypothetical protein [Parasedimentitalea maritima]|uniref:Type IV pilus biogenesis n=1 Tax=Parasedimentitalea maritima TaxID=2578117 RepID=A0A6A4RIK1_9RHOB|nr:hypothetical protein [Zongyanglinia marina]KAE9629714.1 hypothetical protein GP644_11930 [Zongyanglinia marina]